LNEIKGEIVIKSKFKGELRAKLKNLKTKDQCEARKFGNWYQSKSGVNLKDIESLMVDVGQIDKIENQGPILKRRSN
jgi:ribosomal protein L19E